QKIEIYKRIRQIDSREIYEELQEELVDRFGEYSDEVAYLLEIGLLKHFANENKMIYVHIRQANKKAFMNYEKVCVATDAYETEDKVDGSVAKLIL
ncbi:MAG: TRCF domain-containing protein, partial [Staphylococcus epidermidis]|nr:TRCF domain-containing protein [Staphylococcus epidermidis]